MKNEKLKNYLIDGKIDIDKIFDEFYGYIYIIVKNTVKLSLTNEDLEEIISDVFVAIWKNSSKLSETTNVKAYLAGAAKNIIKNKYRKTELNLSISDYEEKIIDNNNLEKKSEENEQNAIISKTLKTIKAEEYQIFIMFYYEGKTIKEIAQNLEYSIAKVKIILHRVRNKLKKNLIEGGYSYGKR